MVRTLCTLYPDTKQDGTRCLKGQLSRTITTTASDGAERIYPAGTDLVLTKHANGSYSLLAMVDDGGLQREIDSITPRDRETASPF